MNLKDKMDKLKKVFSGQEDDEQDIVAQVMSFFNIVGVAVPVFTAKVIPY